MSSTLRRLRAFAVTAAALIASAAAVTAMADKVTIVAGGDLKMPAHDMHFADPRD